MVPVAGIKFWAGFASVAIHVLALTVLGLTTLSPRSEEAKARPVVEAKLLQARRLWQAEPVTVKPEVKASDEYSRRIKSKDVDEIIDFSPRPNPTGRGQVGTLKSAPCQSSLAENAARGHRVPRIEFFGAAAKGRRVCYLVDRSGSMYGVFGRVKQKLRESISHLKPDQYFSVIFFGGDQLVEFGRGVMFRATEKMKASAYSFIDNVSPQGKTNAVEAFRRAVDIRDRHGSIPSVIYFLTDGFELSEDGGKRFVSMVMDWWRRYLAGVKINTIGFWPNDEDRKMLEALARQSSGEFVLVGQDGENPGGSED